jgi:hypothetical protein
MNQEKQPSLDESTPVFTNLRTIGVLIAGIAAGVSAWAWALSDVRAQATLLKNHGTRIEFLETRFSADHDLLLEIRGDVKALRERSGK